MKKSAFAAAAVALFSARAAAQEGMSLRQVLDRARAQAPQVLSANARIEETRARMVGARLRARDNPTVDAVIGPRFADAGRTTDLEFTAAQVFEPGSRRSARIQGTEAGIEREGAAADDVRRQALETAATAFYRAQASRERIGLLAAAETLAAEAFEIAQRRYRAGDLAVLDVNVAATAVSRARAARRVAEAEHRDALGDLRILLDLPDDGLSAVSGTLAEQDQVALPALLEAAAHRPDVRMLMAESHDASADIALGKSFRRPDWGWAARYSREQRDEVVMGGISLTLPLFNRGQELMATGAARATRLSLELDARRRTAEREVRTAYELLQIRQGVVAELSQNAVAGADQNDALARRSFEVGEIRITDWLLFRREVLDARLSLLEAMLEAALARVRVDSAAGVLQ